MLKSVIDREGIDIAFLQETHVDSIKFGNQIADKLEGKIIWSLSHPRGKGVGVYFSSKLQFVINQYQFDPLGRFVVVDVTVNNYPLKLVNVYAPNVPSERKQFFLDLYPFLLSSRPVILSGDFNCIGSTRLDKVGGNPLRGTDGWPELNSLLSDFNLSDAYRHMYPNQVAVTWRSKEVSCRLDRVYLPSACLPQLQSVQHKPNPISDHDLVLVKLAPFSDNFQGRGYWKFNKELLKDADFRGKIQTVLHWASDEIPTDLTTVLCWWDNLKADLKEISIDHSKLVRRRQSDEYNTLCSQYLAAERAKQPEQMQIIKNRLQELDTDRWTGAQVRSKAYLLDNREKPSRYFYRKELQQSKRKTIEKVVDSSGHECTSSQAILDTFRNFYSNLYTSEPVSDNVMDEFLSTLPQCDPEASESLGEDISEEEIEDSIDQMENHKSPGPDGFPKEFYATFCSQLSPILTEVYKAMYYVGSLSDSQKTSYITLLCKDENGKENPKNYRPISLLNVDYKILTKVLCNRLRPLLSELIHPDQTCAVPGRSITDSCYLIRDQIEFCNKRNSPGILLSVDQEKAFDRVNHYYLIKTLAAYGLGEKFIRWIALLYTDINSSVIVNQHISSPFPVDRSVRQGCPLSPLLYVLCLEPVLCKIRADQAITGLHLPGNKHSTKLAAFADDSKFLLADDTSAHKVLQWFDHFGRASGSKLNKQKTEGMDLGSLRTRTERPLAISWVDSMKVFGICFGKVTSDDIWHPIVKKIDNTLKLFSGRLLSVYGKANLINLMVLSKLWYVGSVMPIPNHYIKLIEKRMFDFLWSSKNEPVSRKTMFLPKAEGGVGLVNIKMKIFSMLLRNILKFCFSKDVPWTAFGHMYLGLRLARVEGYEFSNSHPHSSLEDTPEFYSVCIEALKEITEAMPDFSLLSPLTCKFMYQKLTSAKAQPPKVCNSFPQIKFQKVFQDLSHPAIDPATVNVSFKLSHDVLPVAYKLYLWNYPRVVKFCLMCNSGECETTEHLFFHCSYVEEARDLLGNWLYKTSDIGLTSELIRFGPGDNNIPSRATALILLSEYRYAIWVCRNRVRFDKKRALAADFTGQLVARVTRRLHADHARLSATKFAELWVFPGMCHFTDQGRLEPTLG